MAEPITGIEGSVSLAGALAQVRRFSITKTADNQVYGTSSTAPYKKTAKGQRSWSGVIDVYLEDGIVEVNSIEEGDIAAVVLTSKAAETLTGNCIIDTIENIEVDIEGSGMVGCTFNVTGVGLLA